jgi:hypothetical protein
MLVARPRATSYVLKAMPALQLSGSPKMTQGGIACLCHNPLIAFLAVPSRDAVAGS